MGVPDVINTLENCELFKGLKKGSVESIAVLSEEENYRPGEYIFRQGDFGNRIYIIAEGNISLEREIDLGTRKGKMVIGTLGKGRAFGCWSCLLGEPQSLMSSAICRKSTRLFCIGGSELRTVMVSKIEIGFHIMERICFLLRDRVRGAYGAMEKF
ncbi:MAG: cyclic nucleotide-binding domain-containing protein [Deltaproteobacteria bacterium]|nr:cyclic nucleotide-binding domain-containing protein [Deltaproteobacteria bacterium]